MRQAMASRYSRASREVAGRGSVLNPKFVEQEHCRKATQESQNGRAIPPHVRVRANAAVLFSSEMHSAAGREVALVVAGRLDELFQ